MSPLPEHPYTKQSIISVDFSVVKTTRTYTLESVIKTRPMTDFVRQGLLVPISKYCTIKAKAIINTYPTKIVVFLRATGDG